MVYCSGFLPDIEHYPELSQTRCPAGTTKLGVMPDGSVYPCNLFFGKKEFFLGNILTDPFESIWSHEVLAFFRSVTENPCLVRHCTVRSECHGGCPAHSLFITGDLAAPDPRCDNRRL
jgi:radical SAM protein with 4Fe4S-binding SPASM domain